MNINLLQRYFANTVSMLKFPFINHIPILLFLLIATSAFGQEIMLSGKVTDPKNNGISKASVYLLNTNLGTVTDDQGEFSISDVLPGNYTVQVTAINYATVTKNISLDSTNNDS